MINFDWLIMFGLLDYLCDPERVKIRFVWVNRSMVFELAMQSRPGMMWPFSIRPFQNLLGDCADMGHTIPTCPADVMWATRAFRLGLACGS